MCLSVDYLLCMARCLLLYVVAWILINACGLFLLDFILNVVRIRTQIRELSLGICSVPRLAGGWVCCSIFKWCSPGLWVVGYITDWYQSYRLKHQLVWAIYIGQILWLRSIYDLEVMNLRGMVLQSPRRS
jgi:hypothetical protein